MNNILLHTLPFNVAIIITIAAMCLFYRQLQSSLCVCVVRTFHLRFIHFDQSRGLNSSRYW